MVADIQRHSFSKSLDLPLHTTNLLKTWFLFLVCKKGQKEDKSEFVTKFVGILVKVFFSSKKTS